MMLGKKETSETSFRQMPALQRTNTAKRETQLLPSVAAGRERLEGKPRHEWRDGSVGLKLPSKPGTTLQTHPSTSNLAPIAQQKPAASTAAVYHVRLTHPVRLRLRQQLRDGPQSLLEAALVGGGQEDSQAAAGELFLAFEARRELQPLQPRPHDQKNHQPLRTLLRAAPERQHLQEHVVRVESSLVIISRGLDKTSSSTCRSPSPSA